MSQRLGDDLTRARTEATAAAERLIAACRACADPGQLLIAATAAYLASGRLMAIANRILVR